MCAERDWRRGAGGGQAGDDDVARTSSFTNARGLKLHAYLHAVSIATARGYNDPIDGGGAGSGRMALVRASVKDTQRCRGQRSSKLMFASLCISADLGMCSARIPRRCGQRGELDNDCVTTRTVREHSDHSAPMKTPRVVAICLTELASADALASPTLSHLIGSSLGNPIANSAVRQ